MNNNIVLSFIIPAYNVDKYIDDCLLSIKKQVIDICEVIIINDGSTDNTLQKCQKYTNDFKHFNLISTKNRGLSAARNLGLSLAQGEYIYFFDSDDLIDDDFIQTIMEEIKDNSPDLISFNALSFVDDFKILKDNDSYQRNVAQACEVTKDLLKQGKLCSPVWLQVTKRETLESLKHYFINGILHEDEPFTLKLAVEAKKHVFINRDLFHRRVRENSIMTSARGKGNIYGYLIGFIQSALWYHEKEILDHELKLLIQKRMIMGYLHGLRLSLRLKEFEYFQTIARPYAYLIYKTVPLRYFLCLFSPKFISNKLAK